MPPLGECIYRLSRKYTFRSFLLAVLFSTIQNCPCKIPSPAFSDPLPIQYVSFHVNSTHSKIKVSHTTKGQVHHHQNYRVLFINRLDNLSLSHLQVLPLCFPSMNTYYCSFHQMYGIHSRKVNSRAKQNRKDNSHLRS